MTRVSLLRGTPDAERLVAQAARNDYRSDGVADHDFREVMAGTDCDLDCARYALEGYESPEKWTRLYHQRKITQIKKYTLLKRLMHDGHWGPYEHPQATLELHGVTRVAMAQITRHRHFTFDIMSLRYVDVSDLDDVRNRFEVPPEVTGDEAVTREGVTELDDGVEEAYIDAYEDCIEHYRELLDMGVPQEEARKVLPMGTKVNIVMSGNARAWMHLLNIRGKADVQGEARRLADQIHDALSSWMPYAFEHYDEEMLPMGLNP